MRRLILFVIAAAMAMVLAGAAQAEARPSDKARGPSENGQVHAREGSGRGQNRPGSPGSWKSPGHVPSENSFPQGKAPSDPDGDGNGGLDKPGEAGGFDDDKDGNNGCGNDADREDDNNGWCGLKPKPERPIKPSKPPKPPGGPPPGIPPAGPPPGGPPPGEPPPEIGDEGPPPAQILPGPPLRRPSPEGPGLATTGVDLPLFLFLGGASIGAGVRIRRRR